MSERKFGVLIMQDTDAGELIRRFRQAEDLGFDQVFVADHMADFRDMAGPWLDGWSLLAAAAQATERIRIGTLVANPILRAPAVMAKQALTIDHLSGGRLDLGVGSGIFAYDHHAVGTEPWSVKERVQRFEEYVEILDGVLRGGGEPYTFEGRFLSARDVATAPGPRQSPRPPIIVGGHAPTVLRVAVERAEVWNSNGRWGGGIDFDAPFEDVLAYIGELNRRVDDLAEKAGRDPATLRRSLLTDLLDPGAGLGPEEHVERATGAGFQDFVITWPESADLEAFETFALDVMPGLR